MFVVLTTEDDFKNRNQQPPEGAAGKTDLHSCVEIVVFIK